MDEQDDRRYEPDETIGGAYWELEYDPDVSRVADGQGLERYSEEESLESLRVQGAASDMTAKQRAYLRGEHVGGVYDVGAREREQRRRDREISRNRKAGGRSGGGKSRSGDHRRPTGRRKRRGRLLIAGIALLGVASFAGGFVAMYAAGSSIVGGSPFGGGAGTGWSAETALAMREDYEIEPLAELLAFRDLSYVPVKGIHLYANKAGDEDYLDRVIEVIDRTELNAIMVTLKSDKGWLAYDADTPLGEKYGTIKPTYGIEDLDAFLAKLAEHKIVPIARITCFKDDVLPRSRPDLGLLTTEGTLWTDYIKSTYLNPYDHQNWEYLVQVAEDAGRRGFREIQFDYVRFPSDGDLNTLIYPGRYCAKEDAIAGFLAYARPRLEALGVWVSADVFGMTVKASDDQNIGQQFEKVCREVDIVLPMCYPSSWTPWMYGIQYPPGSPAEITTAAYLDAARRAPGTGAKVRPLLQAADDWGWKHLTYTPEMQRAQVAAVEALGFNEWMFWGGYNELALRLESTGEYPVDDSGTAGADDATTKTNGQ